MTLRNRGSLRMLASRVLLASTFFLIVVGAVVPQRFCLAQHESGSLGVTGDLSDQLFAIVPGQTISPAHNSMIIINQSNRARQLELAVDAPRGFRVHLNQPPVVEPGAGERVVVSISRLGVAPSVTPGDYTVTVRALPLEPPQDTGGELAVLPGVAMGARVRVEGEAGYLRVLPTDPAGVPIQATVEVAYGGAEESTLYRVVGELDSPVAPGPYTVRVRLGGRVLASRRVHVRPRETTQVLLPVETVSFVNAAPVVHRRSGKVVFYELRYDIQNRLERLGPVDIRLELHGDDGWVVIDSGSLPQLPLGVTGGSFHYAPSPSDTGFGWQKLRLVLSRNGEDLALGPSLDIQVKPQTAGEWVRYSLEMVGASPGGTLAAGLGMLGVLCLAGWAALRARRRGVRGARGPVS